VLVPGVVLNNFFPAPNSLHKHTGEKGHDKVNLLSLQGILLSRRIRRRIRRTFTLIESPVFSARWPDYLSEDERGKFAAWLARYPEAGDVVPGSGGVRKLRWSRDGQGKRGGVRSTTINSAKA